MSFVTLATYTSPFEAEIIKGRLEGEGLTVRVADAETVTADWTMSQAIGGVKVRVLEAEAARAREILSTDAPVEDAEAIPEADVLVWRALQASVLGLLFPPLQVYAMWLLVRYARLPEGKSAKTQRRALWAVVFMLPYVAVLAAVWLS